MSSQTAREETLSLGVVLSQVGIRKVEVKSKGVAGRCLLQPNWLQSQGAGCPRQACCWHPRQNGGVAAAAF